ncbi:magnesium-transporting ATPase (P-type) [Streptococcus rupicaprae]|uniref:Magnesium-transporting ATPase (P-type) n=1 Tax=Streptococcus rupicaprae TaxID=759619 RepID=A0ABV2FH20_9STRE
MVRSTIFQMAILIAKIGQWFLTFLAGGICLGLLVAIFRGDLIEASLEHYPGNSQSVSNFLVILVLLFAIVIVSLMIYVAICTQSLFREMRDDRIFILKNIHLLYRILFCLITITLLQMIAKVGFSVIEINNVSQLSDFTFQDYWFHLILIGISCLGILVLKRGYQVETDYNEII